MNVSEALERRRSIRAYRQDAVSGEMVQSIIARAGRAPSGGNLQPWHVHTLTGAPLDALKTAVAGAGPDPQPGYRVYPDNLVEPYRTRRFECGEDLYATLGIGRADKAGRLRQLSRNAILFGAPVGIFITVDRRMGPPQWADLGIFIQSVMLLAVEQGLDTCAQEFWALYARTVEHYLAVPPEQLLFCGIALGYRDDAEAVNSLRTRRAPLGEWASFKGFDL